MKQDFVQRQKDGRRNLRYKAAPSVALPAGVPEDSQAFLAVYKPALAAAMAWMAAHDKGKRPLVEERKKGRIAGAGKGTVDAAIHDFYQTDKYKSAPHNTQRNQRYNLSKLADFANGGDRLGDVQIAQLQRRHIRNLLTKMSGASARPFLSAVKALVQHCIALELIDEDADPTLGLKAPARGKRDGAEQGFKPWTEEMVEQFRTRWAVGTEMRTGLELIRYTGCAAVDAIKLGWGNIKPDPEIGNIVRYRRTKTDSASTNPLWPALEAYLVEVFGRDWQGPFIRGRDGEPTNGHNFSERFRTAARAAGIEPGHSAHGVRKRYVTDLAENGATTTELKAAGGWRTEEEAAYYTRSADQAKASRGIFRKMLGGTVVPLPKAKKPARTNANAKLQAAV